jgi:hypothetical protein
MSASPPETIASGHTPNASEQQLANFAQAMAVGGFVWFGPLECFAAVFDRIPDTHPA